MRSLLTVFRKYFFQAFSIGAVLTFLLSNIFQPSFWSLQTARATDDEGIGISLDDNGSYGTSLKVNISNNGSRAAGPLEVDLGVYHCNVAGGGVCAPDWTPDDMASDSQGIRQVTVPVPEPGVETSFTQDELPNYTCGRVQVDYGRSGHGDIMGGKVFDLGTDCGTSSNKTAELTASCPGNTPTLGATWNVGSGSSCNIYIQAGDTPNKISSDCSGNVSKSTLDPSGPVVDGGSYMLFASDGTTTTESKSATVSGCSAPPPPSTCSYSSTQARWQKDSNDPWGESKTINVGQSARVGGFHDGTGQLAGDVTLAVTGPDTNTTLGNGGTFAPPKAGNYQLKVTTNNQSGSNCEGAASLIVNVVNDTPACPYSSTQARLQKNTSDSWDNSKTINMGEQIRVGGFHDGTGQLANDVNLNVTGVASLANIGNGNFIQPNLAGSYTLTVTTTDGSGAACTDTATFQVNEAACVPDDSTCSASAPACGTTTTGEDNCGNTCTKQGEACAPGCTPDSNSCSAVMPSACGQVNTGKDNCGNACFKQSAACQPQGGITVTNTNNNTNNNSNTNNITFGNVGVGTNTQVLGVTQLPKTGLPAIAWLVSALIPTGFGLRRFRGIKKELEDDPNYIWEDRKFKSS